MNKDHKCAVSSAGDSVSQFLPSEKKCSRTTFIRHEDFFGPLTGMMSEKRQIGRRVERMFEGSNGGLKELFADGSSG